MPSDTWTSSTSFSLPSAQVCPPSRVSPRAPCAAQAYPIVDVANVTCEKAAGGVGSRVQVRPPSRVVSRCPPPVAQPWLGETKLTSAATNLAVGKTIGTGDGRADA